MVRRFLDALREQRWDDHRFYHHSRVNQSLHFFSACCFLVTYVLLLTRNTAVAVVFGWTVAMVSRQVGHFFFEPKGYDEVNRATHEYKESVKVGYNLRRKVILHSVWAAAPVLLLVSPTFFGVFAQADFVQNLAKLWLAVAAAALVGRTIQLFFIRDVLTGAVWFTKILTDPFNDFLQYRGAPLALLRGERMDPMPGRT
ncbi:MAG TPA: Mpo1-like protein [Myxococcales bacterium]|nr:Mpo1-like protein [Myxococcales bacterium]